MRPLSTASRPERTQRRVPGCSGMRASASCWTSSARCSSSRRDIHGNDLHAEPGGNVDARCLDSEPGDALSAGSSGACEGLCGDHADASAFTDRSRTR